MGGAQPLVRLAASARAAEPLAVAQLRPGQVRRRAVRQQGQGLRVVLLRAVDVRDIAGSAAAVLTGAGPTGRAVAFHDAHADGFAAALAGVLPPWQVEGLAEDYAHYARGEAAEVHTAVADLTGRPARDIADFARDHSAAFGRG
ncbi:hypothetical protein [Nocardiopsis halophila]|uniref:hypothetical protein n=1 Tax=Nocardiopsis halophila TaxID=141692 RepID=UPI001F4C9BCC|nr:hypothetical protein [Nocardiopsis halophila]